MDDSQIFAEQEEIISYVKRALLEISQAPNEKEKEQRLYNLLAYLISSSNEIAQKNDFYEAAGRLYSAAYYLEQLHPSQAREIYDQVIKYYRAYSEYLISQHIFSEAANVMLKIATIFKEKLRDEKEYAAHLELSIELLQKTLHSYETNTEDFDKSTWREICHIHQNLALLYEKLEKWEDMLAHARQAHQIGIKIQDYLIVANSQQNIARAVKNLHGESKSLNVILEGIDFFVKEAEKIEAENNLLVLSQIYQIIKNFYEIIGNINKFEDYARKEAGVYLLLANQGIKNHIKNEQIASLYRGAALCYQSVSGNILDAASCFFLAAHYAQKARKYYDAALSYEDAARKLEELHKYQKAWDLYQLASSSALRVGEYEIAIINLFNAESVGLKIKADLQSLYHKLHKYMRQYAEIQHEKQNFFIAGTLYLEAAENLGKLRKFDINEIKSLLQSCLLEYTLIFQATDIIAYPLSSIYYVSVLIGILNPIISSFDKELMGNIPEISIERPYIHIYPDVQSILDDFKAKAPKKYLDLLQDSLQFVQTGIPLRKSFFVKNRMIFNEHGINEIKKIHNLMFDYPQLMPSTNALN